MPITSALDNMSSIQNQLGLDNESYGKLKLFNRILISYNDFKQAYEITCLLLDQNLYKNYPRDNRHLVIALNMAAIVAYARPFLDSRGVFAHNRLPGRALRILSDGEREVHEAVMEDRHTMMAHSDADTNLSIPLVMKTKTGNIVITKNASPYESILLPEAMQTLSDMSLKLQEYCFELRHEMEPEMILILPKVEADRTNDT